MKRILKPLIGLIALCLLLSSCEMSSNNDNSGSESDSGSEVDNVTASQKGEPVTVYDYTKDLAAAQYSTEGATTVTLKGSYAEVSGSGAKVSGSTVTITTAGVYILSGSLSNGQIIVDTTKDDHVKLVLDNVSITCSNSAPIYCKQADKMIVILAEDSVNTLTDATEYVYADGEDEPNAALFSKDDLTLAGNGKLTVNANFNNGITSKDDLCILGGAYTVTAVHDALRGKDCLAVYSGTFVLKAGNDGLKSNNETDADAGYIVIDGGSFTITAGHDGFDAADALTINDGTFNIPTGEGSAAAPVREGKGATGGGGGGRGNWPGNNENTFSTAAASTDEDDETSDSYKALKSASLLQITGGIFTIDAYDDAVHSNTNVIISGGTLNIKAGDDGIHGDDNVAIINGKITIEKSYEGIESSTIDIKGGMIDITSSDDGINASDGTGAGTMGSPGNGNDALYIRINGGEITINAGADGVDSNGNMFLDGGNIYAVGSSDPESAIDADGTITVSGGTVVGIGSTGHMESPTESSTQPTLMIIFSSEQAAGTMIKLTDAKGNVIFEGTSQKVFQSYFFSDPSLVKGESYTLYVDGQKKVAVTLATAITICSETGGTVSSNNGGMGGGRPR